MIAEKGAHAASGFSQRSRHVRFELVERCLRQFSSPDLLVVDYGCNDGELYSVLKQVSPAKPRTCAYIGMDINPKLVKWARERWREQGIKFMVGNVLEDAAWDRLQKLKADVIVASGVLSYSGDAHAYPELLYRLFTSAKQGVIFNVLSADIPKEMVVPTKGMIRWKPAKLLRLIQACGCNSWELIRSYLHNDITVVMRRDWSHFVYPK